MFGIILTIHVLVSLALIGLVLIQHGKGADVGAAFGSGASNTMFGSQGSSSFLFKLTCSLAAVFFVTSLILGYMGTHHSKMSKRQFTLPQQITQSQQATKPQQKNVPVDVKKVLQHSNNAGQKDQKSK